MLKRQFILQDIYSKKYAFKNKEGRIFLSNQYGIKDAHLFDTKTEIYEFIESANTGNIVDIIYFKIDEVIS